MTATGSARMFLGLGLYFLARQAVGDGKVFAPPEVHARVEIPNQQAMIYHHRGVERLVIETSFVGSGTRFAWVGAIARAAEG